jgi:ATP-binding cassette subfamily F protein uup
MRVIEYVKNIAESFPLASGGSLSAAQFLDLFLFPPDQQYTYISRLSGGEKRRLHLLSILFRNPNFLILDEPTNDLDLPTLGVLENFLSDFQGCLLIVSHDRYFMDRLVDHLFVFDGDGVITDFPGNYTQYRLTEKDKDDKLIVPKPAPIVPKPAVAETPGKPIEKRKLTYKEKREFEALQKEMSDLEKEKIVVTEKLNSSSTPFDELQKMALRIGQITAELDEKELRWLELSEIEG